MEKLRFALFALLLIYCCDLAPCQEEPDPIEVTKCTKYKKQVYEEIQTYGFLIHGAEEMKYIVNKCKQSTPFIVNGKPANPKEFPLMARLGHAVAGNETKWFCGGTLISEKFVLTAAHCFESQHGVVNVVRLGELVFDSTSDDAKPEDFEVERNIRHPEYDDENTYNDLGLIELKKSVAFDNYKLPACLPVLDGDEFDNYIAIGWGSTRFADLNGSKTLLKVKLDRFSTDRCGSIVDDAGKNRLSKGLDTSTQLCAGSMDTRDTCSGDSGGPLLGFHSDYPCMYFVVGVTSLGIGGCGTPNVPGLYTRVYNYVDWIKEYIWK